MVEARLFGKDFGGPDGRQGKRDGDPGHAEIDPRAEVGVVRTRYCCHSWMDESVSICAIMSP